MNAEQTPERPEDRAVGLSALLALKFREAIARREWITACANHETAKFGEWQANWYAVQQDVDQDINDLRADIDRANNDLSAPEAREEGKK